VTDRDVYAEVVVVGKVDRPLTYRVPDALRDSVRVGCAVRVPLKTRQVSGFVVSLADRTEIQDVKDILGLLDHRPVLTPSLLDLGRWMASYYMASAGDVLRRMIPPGMIRATRCRVAVLRPPPEADLRRWRTSRPKWAKVWEAVSAGGGMDLRELGRMDAAYPGVARRLAAKGFLELRQELAGREVGPKRRRWVEGCVGPDRLADEARRLRPRAPRLASCLDVLAASGGAMPSADLVAKAGASGDAVRRLAARGLVKVEARSDERRAPVLWTPEDRDGYRLTDAQMAADRRIEEKLAEGGFAAILLHGVTGSGKTEIFLRAVARVLSRGRKALVLVPEISLAAQTVGQVRERFGGRVEVFHSGLGAGQRRDSWHRIRRGEVDVVVGARSAVFAPLEPLGLVVVDEEQESAYKESESPRYHGRDVALVRSKLAGALAILSTATPSFESFHNALGGKYEYVRLEDRVEGRPLPPVEIVDLRKEPRGRPRVLSLTLMRKVEEVLGRREQVILFLNRRSYAPHVQCPSCGLVFACSDCDVALAYHAREREMKCHLCGHRRSAAERCPGCGEKRLRYSGVGTQRVERELKGLFPSARVVRMDLDTTRRAGAHAEIIDRFRRREADILLGTQMIAKGLDFPGVSLVGVINADTALNLPDFRASERTFDLLAQVAGRAGRGEVGGEVVIQTFLPSHVSLECAQTHDFVSFYHRATDARRAVGYPPWTRLVRVVCEGADMDAVASQIRRLADRLRRDLERRGCREGEVVGPAPAGFARVRGKHRWHLIIKCTQPGPVREAIRSTLEGTRPKDCRLVVDVDPQEMM